MRAQDFLGDYFKDLKFRVSYPNELVTTQEVVDKFAIGFTHWCTRHYIRLGNTVIWEDSYDGNKYTTHQLLEIYKNTL